MHDHILAAAKKLNILIIGDVMIDRYLSGKVNRISPEAPVPVVSLKERDDRMGGAGNVALNIAALGATPILCSIIGADDNGQKLKHLLQQKNITTAGIILSKQRKTTVKTRVLANNQQLLRVDDEDTFPLPAKEEQALLEKVKSIITSQKISAIIFQDYNKGVLTGNVISNCIQIANTHKIPTIVDPKFHNFWAYKSVTLFKPNLKEIRQSVPFTVKATESDLKKAAKYVRSQLGNPITLITLSEKGLYIDQEDDTQAIFPTQTKKIVDVCGAGDSVISIVAIGIALGLPLSTIALLANWAGGQVCEAPGVVSIDLEKLNNSSSDFLKK